MDIGITIHTTYLYYIGSIIKYYHVEKMFNWRYANELVSTNMSIKWSHSLGISLFDH